MTLTGKPRNQIGADALGEAVQWLLHESGEFERIRPDQTAFEALGMRDYSWRYPRMSDFQESQFDQGNVG